MATTKPNLTRIWASAAPGGNVEDPDVTSPGKFSDGWTAEIPPFENFNFLQQLFTQGLAYINENGIGEWDTDTTYPINGVVRANDSKFYISIQKQNGNNPVSDDGTNWQLWFNSYSDLKSGRKNYIINGDMDLWQRGTGPFTGTEYTADRWLASAGTGGSHSVGLVPFTLGQSDVPNNPTYFLSQSVSVAGSAPSSLLHRIESVSSLAGKKVALSFWCRSSNSRNLTVTLEQFFGTGGSPSSPVNISTSVAIQGGFVWQKVELLFDLPSVFGKTLGTNINDYLQLGFLPDTGVGQFDLSQVQLEEGEKVTNFEYRNIAEELNLCQRFYEVGFCMLEAYSAGSGSISMTAKYQTRKRTSTTKVLTDNGSAFTTGVWSSASENLDHFRAQTFRQPGDGQFLAILRWTADCEL